MAGQFVRIGLEPRFVGFLLIIEEHESAFLILGGLRLLRLSDTPVSLLLHVMEYLLIELF